MRATTFGAILPLFLRLLVAGASLDLANAQTPAAQSADKGESERSTSELLQKLDQLVEQNQKLEKQNRELMEQIEPLRRSLLGAPATVTTGTARESAAPTASSATVTSRVQPAATPKTDEQTNNQNPQSGQEYGRDTTWNLYEPGKGFDVAKTEYASLNISGYLVARYLNQLPPNQSFVDHNGQKQSVDARQDFQLHRVMLYFTGNLFNPKFNYNITLWTVNDTAQQAIVGALYYSQNKHLLFGVGWNGIPGTRSMQGSHPYWTSYDRVMADEFFRPYFTQAFFAEGALPGRLNYKFSLGNNLSNLDITAVQLTRDLSQGVSLTWMPTTGEFGPRGAFGDYEEHQAFATRFGVDYSHSREDRFNSLLNEAPDNTTIRLGDSLLLFGPGSLSPNVTVQKATYQLLTADGGLKYKGFWLQSEGYFRLLNNFVANGLLPVGSIRDQGFYVQTAYMVVPKKVELYGATSWVFPEFHPQDTKSPHEALGGLNWYTTDSRNYRINLQVISVDRSPVSSTFGFYTGGLKGVSFTLGATALF